MTYRPDLKRGGLVETIECKHYARFGHFTDTFLTKILKGTPVPKHYYAVADELRRKRFWEQVDIKRDPNMWQRNTLNEAVTQDELHQAMQCIADMSWFARASNGPSILDTNAYGLVRWLTGETEECLAKAEMEKAVGGLRALIGHAVDNGGPECVPALVKLGQWLVKICGAMK
jgi:hypothetical protein